MKMSLFFSESRHVYFVKYGGVCDRSNRDNNKTKICLPGDLPAPLHGNYGETASHMPSSCPCLGF